MNDLECRLTGLEDQLAFPITCLWLVTLIMKGQELDLEGLVPSGGV